MSFSIHRSTASGLTQLIAKDEKAGVEISILPDYGAILHTFRIPIGGTLFNVIDNYRDLEDLEKDLTKSFKGPKLSPFPCRIADSIYHFDGQEYSFRNPATGATAIHGLVYNKAFTLTAEQADEQAASLTLEYLYRKDNAAYPHTYSCRVIYTLHPEGALTVTTVVTNLGEGAMPLADGWHPYFRLTGKVDEWTLQFNAEEILEFNEQLIPTGKLLSYKVFTAPRSIEDRQLDNCFLLTPDWQKGENGKAAACEISNPANGLSVAFFPDESYPFLQIYIPPARESIAIENLSGAPDCFNNKMGLLILEPGQSKDFTVRYQVSVK